MKALPVYKVASLHIVSAGMVLLPLTSRVIRIILIIELGWFFIRLTEKSPEYFYILIKEQVFCLFQWLLTVFLSRQFSNAMSYIE